MIQEGIEKVIKDRLKKRERAIAEARSFALCVARALNVAKAWLYGSYARGDFNEWSDIDVLVVVRGELPKRPTERLSLIDHCLERYSGVEPILVTEEEFEAMKAKRNPIAEDIERHGIYLLAEKARAKGSFGGVA